MCRYLVDASIVGCGAWTRPDRGYLACAGARRTESQQQNCTEASDSEDQEVLTLPDYEIIAGCAWYTFCPPIWILDLLRCSYGVGTLVLKNTWRRTSRISEAAVYAAIKDGRLALAEFWMDENVQGSGAWCIFVGSTRMRAQTWEEEDVILHRLLYDACDRRCWEYRSEGEQPLDMDSAHWYVLSICMLFLASYDHYVQRISSCADRVFCNTISMREIPCSRASAETTPETDGEGILLDLDCVSINISAGIIRRLIQRFYALLVAI